MNDKTMEERFTFCRICEAHCGLIATVEGDRVTALRPNRENLRSRGFSCVKGTNFHRVAHDPDRVTRPLKRTGGPGEFTPVSWDEALDDIAARLRAILDTHGPDAVASYKGNPIAFATEATFGLLRFLDHFGIWKYYGAGSQDTNARMSANYFLYGSASSLEIPDLANCDQLYVFGANPLVSNGSVLGAVRCRDELDAIAARGRVVVIDPRRTETAERYEHVSIQPNSDAWLLIGMIRHLFETGAVSPDIAARTTGLADLERAVMAVPLARCAEETRIAAQTIADLAARFAKTPRSAAYARLGLSRGPFATLESFLVSALNVIAGKFGEPGGIWFPVPILAGSERPGGPGYGDRASRHGKFPAVLRFLASAVMPEDLAEEGEGKVRALMTTGGNVVLAAPGGAELERQLQQLELFFSIDLYVNESNRYADYVLPTLSFLERSDLPHVAFGTMLRPLFTYADAVIPPVGGARGEYDILSDIARRMGSPIPGNPPMEDIENALAAGQCGDLFAGSRPFDVLRANPNGIAYPGETTNNPWAKIANPEQRIALWPDPIAAEFARLLAAPAEAEALHLITRRDVRSMNSWLHNVDRLIRSQKVELDVHPDDAARLGLAHGQDARLRTKWDEVPVAIAVTTSVRPGTVCYPHGWGHSGGWRNANAAPGTNINRLLGHGETIVEAISGTTIMDGIPVELVAG